jgi:hypothetical protein
LAALQQHNLVFAIARESRAANTNVKTEDFSLIAVDIGHTILVGISSLALKSLLIRGGHYTRANSAT